MDSTYTYNLRKTPARIHRKKTDAKIVTNKYCQFLIEGECSFCHKQKNLSRLLCKCEICNDCANETKCPIHKDLIFIPDWSDMDLSKTRYQTLNDIFAKITHSFERINFFTTSMKKYEWFFALGVLQNIAKQIKTYEGEEECLKKQYAILQPFLEHASSNVLDENKYNWAVVAATTMSARVEVLERAIDNSRIRSSVKPNKLPFDALIKYIQYVNENQRLKLDINENTVFVRRDTYDNQIHIVDVYAFKPKHKDSNYWLIKHVQLNLRHPLPDRYFDYEIDEHSTSISPHYCISKKISTGRWR